MPDRHPDYDLLRELEPVAEQLLNRHLAMAKEWLPHEYVPWGRGRDFDTEPWTPEPSRRGLAVRHAVSQARRVDPPLEPGRNQRHHDRHQVDAALIAHHVHILALIDKA